MGWQVGLDEVEAIAIGAGVLGTGGGGSTTIGRIRLRYELKNYSKTCQIIDVDDLADDDLVCAVSGMGAPTVSNERLSNGQEMVTAVHALEAHLGKKVAAIIIGEVGGSNAIQPLIAGLQLDLPVVDGDGMGRAFPELQMDTFSIGGIPASPFLLCDIHGNTVIFDHIDTPLRAEAYARSLTIEMGGSALLVMPVMTGAQVKAFIIRDTLSLARDLGHAVLHARKHQLDAAQTVAEAAGGKVLFRGKIVDLFRRTTTGFARGTMKIAAFQNADDVLEIEFQNENLIAVHNGEVICTVPDLITLVSLEDGEPIGTEALRYGLRVAVLGMPAPKQLTTEAALKVIGPAAFGYDNIPFTPLSL
ncbi:MAG: DUF917 domain-containing protein [Anaerolineaceae bacterium]|nr:DUF917 domain-containing protein [Anaerolineaceae bacterium]